MKRFGWLALVSCVAVIALVSCNAKIPSVASIRDSRLIDRRIEESPREKVVRECKQEGERFRVDCTHCHKTDKESEIRSPNELVLTKVGMRAQIMRKSASFGLHKQCTVCHQSKFTLNVYAKELFGPNGLKHKEMENALSGNALK